MDLTSLVLASSAVSLLTLALLLLRRRRPEEERIPSWFLGAAREQALRRLKVATPPWLAWLFVVLFTLAAALLFWPPEPERDARRARRDALVWVDPTLSAHLSRLQNGFEARAVATRIWAEGHALHGIAVGRSPGHPFLPRYDIVPLASIADLEAFLSAEAARLVPFARPLHEGPLVEALAGVAAFRDGAGALFVVSDGQAETLQSLSFLGESFRSGRLFTTGVPRAFEGRRTEIVPRALARAWGLEGDATDARKEATTLEARAAGSRAPDFRTFESGTGVIPLQARPGLAVETFSGAEDGGGGGGNGGDTVAASGLSFVTALDSEAKGRPLLTACGTGVGGPQELDPFSDLRALAGFFSLPLRREECLEHGVGTTAPATGDPWAWRRQSLWIVPLTEEVAGTLGGKGEFWLPAGFEPCCDSIAYTAPLRPSDAPNLEIARAPLQLEQGAPPVPVPLAPRPPQEPLRYPEGLAVSPSAPGASAPGASAPGASAGLSPGGEDTGATTPASDTFEAVLEAADGTPLAYKARRARAAYVRTALAMPNGELGRSSLWSQMWLALLADSEGTGSPRLDVRAPASPADLARLDSSRFARVLATDGLAFRALAPDDAAVGLFAPEGYDPVAEGDGGADGTDRGNANAAASGRPRLTLLAPSPLERVQALLAPEEFEALWGRDEARAALEGDDARPQDVRPRALAGAVLAALSLAGLWVLPRVLARARARGLLLAALAGLIGPASTDVLGLADAALIRASGFAPGAALAQSRGVPGAPDSDDGGGPPGALRRFFFGSRPHAESLAPGAAPGIPFRVAWCDARVPPEVAERYLRLRDVLASRGTIEMPRELVAGGCRPGAAEIWWAADAASLDRAAVLEHVTLGGAFVLEGQAGETLPEALAGLETPAIGLRWERQQRRGLLYRSFYLLASFDGCPQENTTLLSLRKRAGAHSPVALATRARLLTQGGDCFAGDDEARARSFVNLMYALLTTDYKEDQLQLPEILSRVRNLGLEP